MVAMFFSLVTFAGCYLPIAALREYQLMLERAENIATLGGLMSVLFGGALCLGCLWSKVEPSGVLVRYALISIVMCVFVLLFLPAIATS